MDARRAPLTFPFEAPPEPGQAVEVADGILWIRMSLPMRLDHVNCYALAEAGGWTIVDTGFDSRKSRTIWQEVMAGPLQGRPVKRVLVTHHHPDHIGLAGWFQAEHGAELWTTRTAWLMARMLTLDEQARPSSETIGYWVSAGMDAELLKRRTSERPFNFADVVAPLPLGFRRIQHGERVVIGDRAWIVRIGHGHAPEQATLWSESGNVVLGGDQLLATISPNLGVYATEPEADPVSEWLDSCESFVPYARDDQLVLPGHKLPFTGLPKRLDQLIDNHHGALKRLERFLEEPRTAVECFLPLFKRQIGEAEYGLALVEAMAHLNHLYRLGTVSRQGRQDGALLWQRKD